MYSDVSGRVGGVQQQQQAALTGDPAHTALLLCCCSGGNVTDGRLVTAGTISASGD